MKAIIITIGDEILSGATVDTNAAYIAKGLISIGVDVTRRVSVGDNPPEMEREIRDGLSKFDIVITTGGLGPTDDDMTKDVICRVFDTELVEHEDTLKALERRYEQLNLTMSKAARGMAMQPKGATLIHNTLGTAPGILFDRDGRVFCSMAGVPSEMRSIVDQGLLPYLEKRGTDHVIIFKNISTFGIPESKLAERLEEAGFVPQNAKLAFLPSYAGVILRLRADGKSEAEVEEVIDINTKRILDVVGEYVFTTDSRSLLEVVTDLIKENHVTVSAAESCTGGLISKLLTDVSGSSGYFTQSIITYANEAKIDRLGVRPETIEKYGAVSEQTCREMVEGMLRTAGTDYAVASTGIAGPTGGTDDKPVGMVYLGVANRDRTDVRRFVFSGDRDVVRTRSAFTVLNMLRLRLLGK